MPTTKPAKKTGRVYFEQYDTVWSMKLADAIKFVNFRLGTGDYDLDKFGKRIKKRKEISWRTYLCLDWDDSDWKECKRDILIANGIEDSNV